MTQYIFKRLLLFVPTALGVSILIFIMLRTIPGDYITATYLSGREETFKTQEDIDRIKASLGFDKPLHMQYLTWTKDFFTGSFGESLTNRLSIRDNLTSLDNCKLCRSAELAILAMIIAVVIAIPAGIFAAIKQDRWPDYILRTISMGFEAMPGFWVALILLLLLLKLFDWIPPVTYQDFWEDPWTNFQIMVFPALVVGARASAGMLRMTRAAVLEVVREDYIRTALAKGLRHKTVLFIHVLKNSLLPVVTLAGFEMIFMMGGLVIIEYVFQIPGVGDQFVRAAARQDYPMVQAIVMWVALTVLIANLVVDLMYAWLDPRIRYS